MRRKVPLWPVLLLLTRPSLGQELPLLDLEAYIGALIERGPKLAALRLGLAEARADLELAAAALEPSLATAASISGTGGFGEGPAISSAASGAALGLAGSGSASLSLGMPRGLLGLSASQSLPSPESSSVPTTRAGLSLSQTVSDGYPGGRARGSFERSRIAFRVEELAEATARRATLAEARRSYAALLSAERAFGLAEEARNRRERLLAQVRSRRALGEAGELELRRAEFELRRAEFALRGAEAELRGRRRALALSMGEPEAAVFRLVALPEPRPPAGSLEEALRLGLAGRAELEGSKLAYRRAEIDFDLEAAKAAPSLALEAGLSLALRGGDSPSEGGVASLSLRLGLPLLDGGALAALRAGASARRAAMDREAELLPAAIAREIAEAWEGLAAAREGSELAAEAAALAEAELALVEARYRLGTASLEELLEAQLELEAAQGGRLEAVNEHLAAVLDLEAAMGL